MKMQKIHNVLLLAVALVCLPMGAKAKTLTVADGTKTNYSTIFGVYADDPTSRCQSLYLKDSLEDLTTGSIISGLTFYSSSATMSWGNLKVDVKLAEVPETMLGENLLNPDFTTCFSGAVSVADSKMTIGFTTSFNYSGDNNLLIEFAVTEGGTVVGDGAFYFYGEESKFPVTYQNKVGKLEYFLPKVTFTYTATTCPGPTNLTRTAVNATSASFSWTDDSGSEWQYVCLPEGTAVNWGDAAVKTATSPTVTVDGLTHNTTYKFYVRHKCGGEVGQSPAVSAAFTTPCEAKNLPYVYGFEDVVTSAFCYIPDGWSRIKYIGGNVGNDPVYPYVANSNAHTGSKALYFYGGTSESTSTIILPPFDAPANTLILSFYYKHNEINTNQGKAIIGYVTDLYNPVFYALETLDRVADYTLVDEFALSAAPADSYIAIQFGGGTSADGALYIDDITVATCAKPTLTPDYVTDTKAVFSWTARGSETQWQYICLPADKEVDWSGEAVKTTETTNVTIDELSERTAYKFYLRAYCSEQEQSVDVSASFTTPCSATTLPLAEDFNGLTSGIPDCWDNEEGTTTTDDYKWNYYSTGSGLHDGACVRFDSHDNNQGNTNILKTQAIHIDVESKLAFWFKNPYGGDFSVYYAIDGVKQAEALVTALTAQTEWTEKTIDLPAACIGHDVVIMFQGTANHADGDACIYLDDVQVVTCLKPTAVSAAATFDGAVVTWTGAETRYQYAYVATGETPENWTLLDAGVNTVTLNGLQTSQTYDVYVRAYCSESDQSVAVKSTFTPFCPAPDGLSVAGITLTTATFAWDAVEGITAYEYLIVKNGDEVNWAGATRVNTTAVNLMELYSGTDYTAYVRSYYSATSVSDAVSKAFSTPVCPAPDQARLSVIGITTTTATFAWKAVDGITAYEYLIVKNGDEVDWAGATRVNTTSVDLTELLSSTNYTAYVRSYYSATSISAAVSIAFHTECETAALPFATEGFEIGFPACWSADPQWTIYSDADAGYNSNTCMRFNAGGQGDLVLPAIALTDKAQLSFYRKSSSVSCKVYVYDNAIEELDPLFPASSDWTQGTVDLFDYEGRTVTLIIRGNEDASDSYLYIDDVAVNYAPVASVTSVTAEAAHAQAVVKWSYAENATYTLRYREKDAEPEAEWTEVENINAKTYTITGLNNGTEYEVQVKAIISPNRRSEFSASVTVTPFACPPVLTVTLGKKTYNSVEVNWTADAAGTWTLRYQDGDMGVGPTITGITETTYTLTDLETNFTYLIEVKASCAEDTAYKQVEYTPGYFAPDTVAVASITDTTAVASWSEVEGATNGYRYMVVPEGATPDWASATATDELTASLSGLSAQTDYDFYVAALYGGTLGEARKVSFTTKDIPNVFESLNDESEPDRPYKVIEDDHVVIIRGGEKYDVTGKRLNQ